MIETDNMSADYIYGWQAPSARVFPEMTLSLKHDRSDRLGRVSQLLGILSLGEFPMLPLTPRALTDRRLAGAER